MASKPRRIPPCWLSIRRSTWLLEKSVRLPGNGTSDVSWLTYRSARPLPRTVNAMPSGMESNTKPSLSVSPTVISGSMTTPAGASAPGLSRAAVAVSKPLGLAAATGAAPAATRAAASNATARGSRPRTGRRVGWDMG